MFLVQRFETLAALSRLRQVFDSMNRQAHVAPVLLSAVGQDPVCLIGVFLHRAARSRQAGTDD